MAEHYRFYFQGAPLNITVDVNSAPTSTQAPNMHVISGSWPTFYLDTGPTPSSDIRVFKSVSPSDPALPHPAGNPGFAASGSPEGRGVLMIGDDGYLMRAPVGHIIVQRLLNQLGLDGYGTGLREAGL